MMRERIRARASRRKHAAVLAALITMVPLAPSFAVTIALPDASYSGQNYTARGSLPPAGGFASNTPQNITATCSYGAGSGITSVTSQTAAPNPSVFASGTDLGGLSCTDAGGITQGPAGGFSVMDYYFVVVGPGLGTVPVKMHATESLSTPAVPITDINLTARLLVAPAVIVNGIPRAGGFLFDDAKTCGDVGLSFTVAGQCGDFTIDTSLDLAVDQLYQVELYASANVGGIGGVAPGTSGSASSFVDPYFFIDPAAPLANQYQIIVSDGVGNNPPSNSVPEPTTLSLLGASLLGWRCVRRRRT